MYPSRVVQLMRPSGGGGAVLQVCQGETMSAPYEDMYTRPDGETATPGQNVSTLRAEGAARVVPSGCVTGYPSAVRFDAFSVAKIGAGALQVTPPSVDLLKTAAAWQLALTVGLPTMKKVQFGSPPNVVAALATSVVHAA